MADSPQPANKLEEQAKGANSYTYFHQAGMSTAAPPPRKLTEAEVAAQAAEAERLRSAQGSSAWNHAGTFEERDWTEWAKSRVTVLLKGESFGKDMEITDVTECSGHANTWIRRGKKTQGFDFQVTIAWKAQVGSTEIRGSAKVPNAASDELDDMEFESVEPLHKTAERAAAERDACKAVSTALMPKLRTALEQVLMELKDK